MNRIISRIYTCALSGKHHLQTDLAVRGSSYRQRLHERLVHYTEPADADSIRRAGDRLAFRQRISSLNA